MLMIPLKCIKCKYLSSGLYLKLKDNKIEDVKHKKCCLKGKNGVEKILCREGDYYDSQRTI